MRRIKEVLRLHYESAGLELQLRQISRFLDAQLEQRLFSPPKKTGRLAIKMVGKSLQKIILSQLSWHRIVQLSEFLENGLTEDVLMQ